MIPQEIKLLKMLSNNDVTFFIPPYQRNYEWTDDQCAVFFEDVVKTYEANNAGKNTEHFFGSITYFQTEAVFGQPSKLVLIDGQQRITTTMLFLVALRDIVDDQGVAKYIDSKYLKNDNVSGDGEYKVKLKQVETDWEAYKNIILDGELSDKEKNSAVWRNYLYFKNKLTDCKANGINLGALIEKGLDKFSVITIELKPSQNEWENPQEIFESMNSLGKPLSLADLVRNYLLLGLDADTQSNLYSQYWMRIENALPGQVSNFIRDYMQAYEQRSFLKATETNYKVLYGLFKNMFAGNDAKALLKDLSECAKLYSYLLPSGSCGTPQIDKLLQDFNRMNVTTAYSFLMVLLKTWKNGELTQQDLVEILDAFRIYCLRRRLIALTAAENKNFPLLSARIKELRDADNKKEKMFEILAHQESALRLPNDIELTRYLETMNFYNFRYSKFYLSLIEEQITRSRPDQADEKLQVEHIMPRTLNDDWKQELGENYEQVHQELLNTIGNLTLIRHNQELGNKRFSEKKQIYENNAGLQIAKTEITNHDRWDANAIHSRAAWITPYLLTYVLAIPDKMRKVNNFNQTESRGLSFDSLQLVGLEINFVDDPSIKVRVVSDKEVEFEGKKWRLSPLTREIQTRRGKVNESGSYQGAWWWEYDGIRLYDIIY